MANQRIQYNIVGRYVNDQDTRDVVGYHLQSLDGSKSGRYTIEQTAFLIGRDQVTNCSAQLYKDKVLFRGKGIALESLPVQKVSVPRSNKAVQPATKLPDQFTPVRVSKAQTQIKPATKLPDQFTPVKVPTTSGVINKRSMTCGQIVKYMATTFAKRYALDITSTNYDDPNLATAKVEGRTGAFNRRALEIRLTADNVGNGIQYSANIWSDNGFNISPMVAAGHSSMYHVKYFVDLICSVLNAPLSWIRDSDYEINIDGIGSYVDAASIKDSQLERPYPLKPVTCESLVKGMAQDFCQDFRMRITNMTSDIDDAVVDLDTNKDHISKWVLNGVWISRAMHVRITAKSDSNKVDMLGVRIKTSDGFEMTTYVTQCIGVTTRIILYNKIHDVLISAISYPNQEWPINPGQIGAKVESTSESELRNKYEKQSSRVAVG